MRIALTVFLALACGAVTFVAYAWLDDRVQRMWRRASLRLARHARRIGTVEWQLAAVAEHLGLEFTTDEPAFESPLGEVTEGGRTSSPAPEVDTVEMHAAFNDSAAELVATTRRPTPHPRVDDEAGRVADVELARSLALLEDRVIGWRRNREAA